MPGEECRSLDAVLSSYARPIGISCCRMNAFAQRSHQVPLSALPLIDKMQCEICWQHCSWWCA